MIDGCLHYDPSKHRRPADLNAELEGLDDPDIEPVANANGRYTQWLLSNRAAADRIPFALDLKHLSIDVEYGVIVGEELDDGRK